MKGEEHSNQPYQDQVPTMFRRKGVKRSGKNISDITVVVNECSG